MDEESRSLFGRDAHLSVNSGSNWKMRTIPGSLEAGVYVEVG